MVQHKDLLLKKNIRLIGIDYDEGYIASAKEHIQEASIENCIRVYHVDVYNLNDMKGEFVLPHGSAGGFEYEDEIKFDAILFSGTFSILHDRIAALKILHEWQNPDYSKLIICQGYQRAGAELARLYKPNLKYITTIDHGQLITEEEAKELFEETLKKECKLKVLRHELIEGSSDNAFEAAYITVLEQGRA